jgi:Domain of unknown function (DUF5122) beta-propeller
VFPVGAVLQSDGRLVLVGAVVFPTGGQFMIVRLTSNGELDPSFGDDGMSSSTWTMPAAQPLTP